MLDSSTPESLIGGAGTHHNLFEKLESLKSKHYSEISAAGGQHGLAGAEVARLQRLADGMVSRVQRDAKQDALDGARMETKRLRRSARASAQAAESNGAGAAGGGGGRGGWGGRGGHWLIDGWPFRAALGGLPCQWAGLTMPAARAWAGSGGAGPGPLRISWVRPGATILSRTGSGPSRSSRPATE